jgi:hypothetical protein
MLDGIRTMISVGYRIDRNNLEKTQKKEGEIPTVRVKRWTPYEVSSVSIPADPTVGVGRSARDDAPRSPSIITSARRGQEHTVKDENTAAGNGTATAENAAGEKMRAEWENNATETERKRSDNIIAIAAAHEIGFDKVREWQKSREVDRRHRDRSAQHREGAREVEADRRQRRARRRAHRQGAEVQLPARRADPGRRDRQSAPRREGRLVRARHLAGAREELPRLGRREASRRMLVPTFTSRESVLEAQYGLPAGA